MPRTLNLVVLGPPGAGKITLAEQLAQIQHVPLVQERLARSDAQRGFVLVGFFGVLATEAISDTSST